MSTFLTTKTFLAIDYGSKVIGLARFREGDPMIQQFGRIIPSQLRAPKTLMSELISIIEEETVTDIVVGICFHRDGNPTPVTLATQQFVQAWQLYLKEHYPLAINFHWQDETLTTFEAKNRQKEAGKKVNLKEIDSLSAVIILEDFLRGQGKGPL